MRAGGQSVTQAGRYLCRYCMYAGMCVGTCLGMHTRARACTHLSDEERSPPPAGPGFDVPPHSPFYASGRRGQGRGTRTRTRGASASKLARTPAAPSACTPPGRPCWGAGPRSLSPSPPRLQADGPGAGHRVVGLHRLGPVAAPPLLQRGPGSLPPAAGRRRRLRLFFFFFFLLLLLLLGVIIIIIIIMGDTLGPIPRTCGVGLLCARSVSGGAHRRVGRHRRHAGRTDRNTLLRPESGVLDCLPSRAEARSR